MTEEKLRKYVYKDNAKIMIQIEEDSETFAKEEIGDYNRTSNFWNSKQLKVIEKDLAKAYRRGQINALIKYKR